MHNFGDIDLNVLRGWKERRGEGLCDEHHLPALARLVRVDGAAIETIHGPDVLVGRYHPQYGPVDVIPRGLRDHENYRLGAPHLHLTLHDGVWTLRTLSPGVETQVGDTPIDQPNQPHRLHSGDEISMGWVRYRFEASGVSLEDWEAAQAALLGGADGPSLFLCRRGAPCGPSTRLSESAPLMVGRSFPADDDFAAPKSWHGKDQPDWDLAGLFEEERKFIAFLHARFTCVDGIWQVEPCSRRRRTFVNRLEIIDSTPVSSGDEVALGSVLFVVHDPVADSEPRRKPIEPPAVVDWQEGSTPILDAPADAAGSTSSGGADE